MRGQAEDIEQAVAELGRVVGADLEGRGWRRRDLGGWAVAAFTKDLPGGVFLGVELARRSFRWPADWPVEVTVDLGAGYGPALDLMPLLTLVPEVVLVPAAAPEVGSGVPVSVTGPRSVAAAGRDVLAYIRGQEQQLAGLFPDVDALERALRGDGAAEPASGEGKGRTRGRRREHLTLLTAMGRTDAARQGLADYLDGQRGPDPDVDTRFARQLGRWLDRGAPTPPPLEDTLALLPAQPRLVRPSRPSLADARDRAKDRREAVETVREQAKGKTPQQLRVMLAAEYDRRGITVSQAAIATAAGTIQASLRPFGRTRLAVHGVRMLTSWGSDLVQLVKTGPPPVPQWRQPPEWASYPVRTGSSTRSAVVRLDPDTERWLAQVWPPGDHPLGQRQQVDVWLSHPDDPEGGHEPIVAHIGDSRVGTLAAEDAVALRQVMAAAHLFDEQPCLPGRLTRPADHTSVILEISLPATPQQPDAVPG
ncbi:MAG: hypothetical protein QOF82_3011 [Frankiales bacterium]|nr:hypothetical protein [Frankiales bacterium]